MKRIFTFVIILFSFSTFFSSCDFFQKDDPTDDWAQVKELLTSLNVDTDGVEIKCTGGGYGYNASDFSLLFSPINGIKDGKAWFALLGYYQTEINEFGEPSKYYMLGQYLDNAPVDSDANYLYSVPTFILLNENFASFVLNNWYSNPDTNKEYYIPSKIVSVDNGDVYEKTISANANENIALVGSTDFFLLGYDNSIIYGKNCYSSTLEPLYTINDDVFETLDITMTQPYNRNIPALVTPISLNTVLFAALNLGDIVIQCANFETGETWKSQIKNYIGETTSSRIINTFKIESVEGDIYHYELQITEYSGRRVTYNFQVNIKEHTVEGE